MDFVIDILGGVFSPDNENDKHRDAIERLESRLERIIGEWMDG